MPIASQTEIKKKLRRSSSKIETLQPNTQLVLERREGIRLEDQNTPYISIQFWTGVERNDDDANDVRKVTEEL
jgi:hypothetical protein